MRINAYGNISKSRTASILSFLVFLAIAVSFVAYMHQSLRLDEAQSLFQTSHSFNKIIGIVSEDVHVPLYHIILYFWRSLFGDTILAGRILSLIFFAATIPATYIVGKKIYGKRVGLFAALLVSISPFLYWYGSEIRMYSLLALIATINQYFFISLYRLYWQKNKIIPEYDWEDPKDTRSIRIFLWISYLATAVAGIYTHYFFWFAILVQGIFLLTYHKSFEAKSIKRFGAAGLMLVLSFLPWLYTLTTSQRSLKYDPNLYTPAIVDVFNVFSSFMVGTHGDTLNAVVLSLWPIATLVAFLMLNTKVRFSPDSIYLFLIITVPVTAAYIISVTIRPLFLNRYFIFLIPSLYILLSRLIYVYSPAKTAKYIRVFMVAVMATGLLYQAAYAQTPLKEDYRAANSYLLEHANPEDIIVVSPPYIIYPLEYYYQGPVAITTLPQWDRLREGPIPSFSASELPQQVESIAGAHKNMWLLTSDTAGYHEDVEHYFENNYEKLVEKELSPGLMLYSYRFRYDTPDHVAVLENMAEESRRDNLASTADTTEEEQEEEPTASVRQEQDGDAADQEEQPSDPGPVEDQNNSENNTSDEQEDPPQQKEGPSDTGENTDITQDPSTEIDESASDEDDASESSEGTLLGDSGSTTERVQQAQSHIQAKTLLRLVHHYMSRLTLLEP